MKDEQILSIVEPHLKEFYSTFILVGFKADTGEISAIGDMGSPASKASEHKKLKPIHRLVRRIVELENEKNT